MSLLDSLLLLVPSLLTGLLFNQQYPSCPSPKNFPNNIPNCLEDFQNWDGTLSASQLWTAIPETVEDIVLLTNWAGQNGYMLRAWGGAHSWSPLTVWKDANCNDTVLVRTGKFTKMQMFPNGIAGSNIPMVLVETGAKLEDLLTYLEEYNYTLSIHPEIGTITIGGVLAIGGHGLGLKAKGEAYSPGSTRGYLSNLIEYMDIVAWDNITQSYIVKTFDRLNKETSAYLVHVGNTFVTRVMLRVKPDVKLRCQSSVDIKITELFGPPTANTSIKTFQNLHDTTEKATTFWFPFIEEAWVLVFSEVPTKPAESREATQPYNYPGFANPFPLDALLRTFTLLVQRLFYAFTPNVTPIFFGIIKGGLSLANSYDIWGTSKNIMLFVAQSAPLFVDVGCVIATKKENMQLVVNIVTSKLISLIAEYESRGEYPMNFPMQIRIAELDRATDTDSTAYLSTIAYNSDNPDFDIGMFFDFITLPDTYKASEFFEELEQFILQTFNNNSLGIARSEWPKAWAYTAKGPFTNENVLKNEVPRRIGPDNWAKTICTYKKNDPKDVFKNKFLKELFVTNATCNTVL